MSVENNSRPWKTKEHHGRVRGHRKGSQLTYLDGQRCLCIAWRDLGHRKADEQISVDIEREHRTQNIQKMQKRRALEEHVLLQKFYTA